MGTGNKLSVIGRSLVIILFVATLWIPLAGMWFGWGLVGSGDEKRRFAQLPGINGGVQSWLNYPNQFNSYFQDHFGFRRDLIRLQALIKVKLLGVSTSKEVIVGKGDWLFYTGDQSLDGYRRSRPFTPQELEQWVHVFQCRRDWLARKGIKLVVFFAPDKQSIYPEYMPDGIRRNAGPSRMDELSGALKKIPGLALVDARAALLQGKASSPNLYNLTDSHWNGFGMYFTYCAIVRELAEAYPTMKPMPRADTLQMAQFASGDLASMLGLQGILQEHLWHLFPRKSQSSWQPAVDLLMTAQEANLPRLVMLRDSFGIELIPFIAAHFSRSAIVQGYNFAPEVIASEQPDVVLIEMAERRLNSAPPDDPVHAMRVLDGIRQVSSAASLRPPVWASAPLPPFGYIDTPAPDAVISGKRYISFGWMLTPQPKLIPVDGSTVFVLIDGKESGHPLYGQFRPDLVQAYPDLNNSRVGAGFFVIDTTKLSNGRHTIAWRAEDNAGGKGQTVSRTFYVRN
jgi:hypothetical protein